MKNIFPALFLFLTVLTAHGQVGISPSGNLPDPSAGLDINFTDRGFLPPRLSAQERDQVANPARGLMIFNTDCNDIQYYNGTAWIPSGNIGGLQQPQEITGNATPCLNSPVVTYSIQPVAGASGYSWMVPPGAVLTEGQGTTSITVTFGNNGGTVCVSAYNDCLRSTMQCLQVTPYPVANASLEISAGQNPVCAGSEVLFTSTVVNCGPSPTYQWHVNGSPFSGATGPAFSYLPANGDMVNCVVETGLSCTPNNPVSSNSLTMTVFPGTTLSCTTTGNSCNMSGDGAIDLSCNGSSQPYLFSWSNGSISEDITGLFAGDYSVTVTDANQCTITGSWVVTEPGEVSWVGFSTDVTCNGAANGQIMTTETLGGSPPYSYQWSNGASTSNLENLAPGLYQLTVTDSHNCDARASQVIFEPEILEGTAAVTGCSSPSACDGSIEPVITGGTPPYAFLWSNGSTEESLSNACPGSYSLTVTDALNCQWSATWVVSSP